MEFADASDRWRSFCMWLQWHLARRLHCSGCESKQPMLWNKSWVVSWHCLIARQESTHQYKDTYLGQARWLQETIDCVVVSILAQTMTKSVVCASANICQTSRNSYCLYVNLLNSPSVANQGLRMLNLENTSHSIVRCDFKNIKNITSAHLKMAIKSMFLSSILP